MPRSRAKGRRSGRKKPKTNLISLLKDVGNNRKSTIRVKKKPLLVQNMGSEGTVTIEKTTVIKSTANETSVVVNDIMSGGGVPEEMSNVKVSFKPKGSDVKCNLTIHEDELSYLEKNLLGQKIEPIGTPKTPLLIDNSPPKNQNDDTKVIHIEQSPIVTKKSKKGKVRGRLIVKRTTVIELTPKNSARDMIPPIVRALFSPKKDMPLDNLKKQLIIATPPKFDPKTTKPLTIDMEKMLNQSIAQDIVKESVAQDCDAMTNELDNLKSAEPFDFQKYFQDLDNNIILSLKKEETNSNSNQNTRVRSNILIFCQSQYVSAPATISSKITDPLQKEVSECRIYLKRSGTVHIKRRVGDPHSPLHKRTVTTYIRYHTSLNELSKRNKQLSESLVIPSVVEAENNTVELIEKLREPFSNIKNEETQEICTTEIIDADEIIELTPSLSQIECIETVSCQILNNKSIEESVVPESLELESSSPSISEAVEVNDVSETSDCKEMELGQISNNIEENVVLEKLEVESTSPSISEVAEVNNELEKPDFKTETIDYNKEKKDENIVHVLETSVMYNAHETVDELFKPIDENKKLSMNESFQKDKIDSTLSLEDVSKQEENRELLNKTEVEEEENLHKEITEQQDKEEEENLQFGRTGRSMSVTSLNTSVDLRRTRSFGGYRKASLPTLSSTSAAFRYASKQTRTTFYDSVIQGNASVASRYRLSESTERLRHSSSIGYGRCLMDRTVCTSEDSLVEKKPMSLRFGPATSKRDDFMKDRFLRETSRKIPVVERKTESSRPTREHKEPDVSSLIRWQLYRDNEFEKIASILPRCRNHGNIAVGYELS